MLAAGVKGTKAGKARGKIRRLTQALGTVRELDVTLQLLDELVAAEKLPRPALEERPRPCRERTRRAPRRHAQAARARQRREARSAARRSMAHRCSRRRAEAWREALGARLLNRSKALHAAMDDAGHMYAPEQLHQVRIAAKKLRYGLELAVDAGVKPALGAGADRQARAGHARPAARSAGAADARRGGAGRAGEPVAARRRPRHHQPRARRRVPAPARDATSRRCRSSPTSWRRRARWSCRQLAHPVRRRSKMTLKARASARGARRARHGRERRLPEVRSEWRRWSCT